MPRLVLLAGALRFADAIEDTALVPTSCCAVAALFSRCHAQGSTRLPPSFSESDSGVEGAICMWSRTALVFGDATLGKHFFDFFLAGAPNPFSEGASALSERLERPAAFASEAVCRFLRCTASELVDELAAWRVAS